METYLTPEQVAERLMVEKTTVYTWLRQKKMKGIKFGKFWRVPEKEVNKTTDSRTGFENKKLDFSKWIILYNEPGDDKYDREFLYSDTERGT
ncbi:MAG: helix-turn-helix domain-containing protein [Ignavibacteriae bacterium]|nr:helix-turn-helix domain-containing protein [Ignavibacteriota bacterium]